MLLADDLAGELLAVAGVLLGDFLAPGFEVLEAAVHAPGDAALQPDHGASERLQQAAVVADQHDAGAGGGEFLLQPLDGGEVEVVGRLVQQQEVGRGGHGAGEGGAAGLAAGEMRRVFVPREAEAVEKGLAAVRVIARS